MTAAVPGLAAIVPDQPQIGLMNQGRRLQRLARFLAGEPLGRELAQLAVDQRQELLDGPGVALVDRLEDAGDLVHHVHFGIDALHLCAMPPAVLDESSDSYFLFTRPRRGAAESPTGGATSSKSPCFDLRTEFVVRRGVVDTSLGLLRVAFRGARRPVSGTGTRHRGDKAEDAEQLSGRFCQGAP